MKLLSYLQQTHGIARRTITEAIKHHELMLNGQIVIDYMAKCHPGDQYIITRMGISGVIKHAENISSEIVLFHKPVDYTVAKYDRHNKTIFEILPPKRRTTHYPVWRLDKDSCGLILLTNNTWWVHELTHPSNEHNKVYHVQLTPVWKPRHKPPMLKWIAVFDEKDNQEIILSCDDVTPIKWWVEITLHEGKNRHIRKMLTELWYTITELKRMSFCDIPLGDLAVGKHITIPVSDLDTFLAQYKVSETTNQKV